METMAEKQCRDSRSLTKFARDQQIALASGESTEQYFLIRNFSEEIFQKLDDDPPFRAARLHYDFKTKDLIIKVMPGGFHEGPRACFEREVWFRARDMGCNKSLCPTGSTTYYGNTSAKQGDGGFKPVPTRNKEKHWPTLIFEIGVSESLPHLRNDARWWLTNSNGDVRIVVIVTASKKTERFNIEKWQLQLVRLPPERRRTRNLSTREPASTTTISVSRQAPTSNWVASGNLSIEFAEVMLRQPVPPEQDFVFTTSDLEELADETMAGFED